MNNQVDTKMMNIEKQADEILALQSIFDKNFRQLDENEYEILIEFDLTSPFTIEYKHKTSIIQYLPSITLIIQYHDEYPSDYPPSYILSCNYLSKYHLEKLCQKLDNYSFVKEEVCIYDWIELIKNEINHINFNEYSIENIEDVIEYNSKREEEQFENQLQTCSICLNIIPGIDCIRLYLCGHFYCRFCLNNYVTMAFENGLFGENIHCPQNQCQRSLLPTEIKRIIQNEQLYERYERLTLQHGLELMKDIVWCPRCQSPVLSGVGEDKLAVCDQCHYTFCKKCLEGFHSQTMCQKDYLIEQMRVQKQKEFEQFKLEKQKKIEVIQQKEKALLNRINKAKETDKTLLGQNISTQEYQQVTIKLSEQDSLLEEVLTSEKIASLHTQRCPKCHIHIEKDGGCSHMFCQHCRHHFIWGTTGGNRMKNFSPVFIKSNQNSMELESVKDELYKVTNIVEKSEEDEITISFDNQSIIGFAILNRVKPCPNKFCGKNNVKIGQDNWMVCSVCMKDYCFLCGKTFRGAQHFDKKCQRYTSV